MSYDPFARGPFPVGVRTRLATDPARDDRSVPIEIWYPATDAHAGRDLDAATKDQFELLPGFPPGDQDAVRNAAPRSGRYPLIAFSHGFGGHRRQTTFLCTHLASHGYVVTSPDHTGNTMIDMVQMIMSAQSGEPMPEPLGVLNTFIALRPADVGFAIDQTVAEPEIGSLANTEHIGMTGHSFGGWTTLAYTGRDRRVRAALPLAPAGGKSVAAAEPLRQALTFDWDRDVATLYLVAEHDSLLPLEGMRELLARTPGSKRMWVLQQSDHMHFCDRAEEMHEMFRTMPPPGEFEKMAQNVRPIGELCPGEHAYQFVRGLGLAHMDAHLKGNESAAQLLAGNVVKLMAERGVTVAAG